MNIYFDKENLRSFVKSASRTAYADCNRMLKNQLNIKFTFAKKELVQDNEIKEWTRTMNTGVNGNVDWEVNTPKRPLTPESLPGFNKSQLSSIYLLDNQYDDEIKTHGLIVYGDIGREVDVLNSMIMKGTDYSFMEQIPIKNLGNWKSLEQYLSPCSDIIILDKYIFSSEDINKPNIYSLLESLCCKAKDATINVVVFTLPYAFIESEGKKNRLEPNWDELCKNIKESVGNITGKEPNVTFVLYSKLEHDRQIFTNYNYIKSGDSFNYFDSAWNVITSGSQIELFSMANKQFYENGFELLLKAQEYVYKVHKNNKDNIKGDKICNYLNF